MATLHSLSSMCVCVHLCIPSSHLFLKNTSHMGLRATHRTSFYLNCLCKGPIFRYSCILKYLGLGLHVKIFFFFSGQKKGIIQPITTSAGVLHPCKTTSMVGCLSRKEVLPGGIKSREPWPYQWSGKTADPYTMRQSDDLSM